MAVFKDETRNTYYVKTYYIDYTGEKKKNQLRRILSVLGVTIIGILAECYVNPLLVKTVLKIF